LWHYCRRQLFFFKLLFAQQKQTNGGADFTIDKVNGPVSDGYRWKLAGK